MSRVLIPKKLGGRNLLLTTKCVRYVNRLDYLKPFSDMATLMASSIG